MTPQKRTFELANERARMMVAFGLKKGLTIDQCLESTGITSDSFCAQDQALFSTKQALFESENRLTQNILAHTRDCPFALGYQIGAEMSHTLFRLVVPSIFSNDKLTGAIETLSGSLSALFIGVKFRVSIKPPVLRLSLDLLEVSNEALSQFILARNMGLIVAIHQLMLKDQDHCVRELGFTFKFLPGMQQLAAHFACPVKYEQNENYLIGDMLKIDFSQPMINEIAAKVIETNCCQMKAEPIHVAEANLSLTDKIWILLDEANNFSLSKDEVAAELNISARTLSRRLQEQGTNWRNLVSELRIKKARFLLEDTQLSLQQIADEIGFSSASAFSNAFSRANDTNAAEYRRKKNFKLEFHKPNHLIGRSKELALLHQGVRRASQGETSLVLINGESGVGKTALVREFYRQTRTDCTNVISGKFDQYSERKPYSSLVQSFDAMVNGVLSLSQSSVMFWKNKWMSGIGDQAGVLIKRFPSLERIVGPQQGRQHGSPSEENAHFVDVFQRLLEVSSSAQNPLILFVDDLQWADVETIELLEKTLTETPNLHLLVIGTYRTSEVQSDHSLIQSLSHLERKHISFQQIELQNLSDTEVRDFVEHAFLAKRNQLHSLSDLCIERTRGNPLYLICFLQGLIQHDALQPDQINHRWRFYSDKVLTLTFTDDIVRILEDKIANLAPDVLKVLQTSALLGANPDYFDLFSLSATDRKTLNALIDLAERKGFLNPTNDKYKSLDRFVTYGDTKIHLVHDKIQQALIESISYEDLPSLHYQVGQHLRDHLNHSDIVLFDLVGHLLKAKNKLANDEKLELANFLLKAAGQARASASWVNARDFALEGIVILGEGAWQIQQKLMSRLHVVLAECLSFLAEHDHAKTIYQTSLLHMTDPLMRARIRSLELTQMTLLGDMQDALDAGLEGLTELGVDLRGEPGEVTRFHSELVNQVLQYADLSLEQLLARSTSNDPKLLAISQLAKGCSPAAFLLGKFHTYSLLVLQSTVRALKYGYTAGSCLVFAAVAPMLPGHYASYSHRLGKLSFILSSRFNDPTARMESLLIFSLYASSWRDTYRETENLLREAICIGNKSGDRLFLSYCPPHLVQLSLFGGRNLKSIEVLCKHHLPMMDDLAVEENKHVILLTQEIAYQLMGASHHEESLPNESKRVSQDFSGVQYFENVHQAAFIASTKMFVAVFLGDYQTARTYVDVTLKTMAMHSRQFYEPERLFLVGMTLLHAGGAEERKQVEDCYQNLSEWVKTSERNHGCKGFILQAEIARTSGQHESAMQAYDEAIEHAAQQDFKHLEGLAAELAGRYLYSLGKSRASARYLKQAYEQYALWGAGQKLRQLEQDFEIVFSLPDMERQYSNYSLNDEFSSEYCRKDLNTCENKKTLTGSIH